jgi:electron transfer flavoprotein alpha subunit
VILVITEQRDGKLNRSSWEAVAAAQALAGGGEVNLAVIGSAVEDVAQELAAAGVGTVNIVQHEALGAYTPDGFAIAVDALIKTISPEFVLLAHTYQARDFAPLAAARANKSLITDVTGVIGTGVDATFTRPMFQGKLAAQVKPIGESPAIVTIQIGAFRADAVNRGNAPAQVSRVEVLMSATAIRQRPEAPFQEAKAAVDLGQAERIVSVGRGIKAQDKLPIAEALAKAMGAELAASRPICDSGWLPMERQIGSSGQTVAPKLYVALGISGAIQHLVGMKGSRTIVAINKDADAPIFEVADYGIVGDLFDIVPAIVSELEKS